MWLVAPTVMPLYLGELDFPCSTLPSSVIQNCIECEILVKKPGTPEHITLPVKHIVGRGTTRDKSTFIHINATPLDTKMSIGHDDNARDKNSGLLQTPKGHV